MNDYSKHYETEFVIIHIRHALLNNEHKAILFFGGGEDFNGKNSGWDLKGLKYDPDVKYNTCLLILFRLT